MVCLQCTPYMNGIMILSPSSGLPCLSSNASHFFVTTVTQPSLTQWFDSLTFRNTFFSMDILRTLCQYPSIFICRGPDDLLSCTFGDGWIFSQRTRNWPCKLPPKNSGIPTKNCNRTKPTKEGLNITFGGFLNKKQKR